MAVLLLLGLSAPAVAQTLLADGSYEVSPNWALKPSGLQSGDKFRLMFVTSTGRFAGSTNIAHYNTFVQDRAKAGHTAIRPYGGKFKAVASVSAISARDNTGTTGTGVPIYWLNGAKIADDYADFYDGNWDSYARKNEHGSGAPSNRVWTGSNNNGTKESARLLGTNTPRFGFGTAGRTLRGNLVVTGNQVSRPFFSLSPVFTVAPDDVVQMKDVKRSIAEFGNDDGRVRISVEIGDGFNPKGSARTINYTVGGTVTRGEGKDYTIDGCTSSTCSVRLPANRQSVQITINVKDDGLDENDETIILTLKEGSGYTVNKDKKTTTITIADDDTRGLTFHRRWGDVDEGSSETITVRLSSQPTAAVTVNIASNNQDVTVSPTSLTFNPSGNTKLWSRAQMVTISAAQDDDAVDDTATLTYTTSGGDYGGANALSIDRPVSVDDDDTSTTTTGPQLPRISLTGGAAVTEGTAASFTVNADPAPSARITVNVEVVERPGQDFVAANQEGVRTVTLNAGATSTTFTVPTVNDNTDEVDGAVQVYVNDGTGYSAGEGAAVTVRDNDDLIPAAYFGSASSSAAEDDGTHVVQVDLTRPAPSGGLTLRYNVSGTATAGSSNDFTIQNSGTVSIAAGAATATIPVAINDDSSTENAETVILTLTGGTGYTVGSPSVHTLTIADNDSTSAQPSVSFASASSSAAESAGTRNVTVTISPAPSGGLTLGYSVSGTATAGGSNDFTIQNSGTLSVSAGATSADIPVAINDDSTDESAEMVILTLTGGTGYTVGSPSVHTLTITDNDDPQPGTPVITIAGGNAVTEGTAASFTLTASPVPTTNLNVNLEVEDSADFVASMHEGTKMVTIGTSGTATYRVPTDNDNTDESNGSVKVTVKTGTGYTVGSTDSAKVTVNDNDPTPTVPTVSLSASSYSVSEGNAVSVTLNMSPTRNSATAVGITYRNGTAGNGDYSKSPGSVTIPASGSLLRSELILFRV